VSVSRLAHIPGIGVNVMGDAADAAADPEMLRLENLDTDLRPPAGAVERTGRALAEDAANSYLPFEGHLSLREAAAAHVTRLSGNPYAAEECVSVAGGLNGILNALLATCDPGREVVLSDPIYAGLVNRVRLVKLRLLLDGAIHPKPASWAEEIIRGKRHGELVLRLEFVVRGDAVFRDADHDCASLLEGLGILGEGNGLCSATRGIILRVEVEHDGFAFQVRERCFAAAIGRKVKRGRLVPDFEGGFLGGRHGIGFRSLTSATSR